MIDYILVNNKYRTSVKDVKVIPGEDIVNQHCLLSMNMVLKKKLKLWRLRESEVEVEFAEGVSNRCDGNEDQRGLKKNFLDVKRQVCGYTKGKPRHFETWWWNKDVNVAMGELFRIWKLSQNEKDRNKYCEAKMDQQAQEAVEKVDLCCNGCELFRIAKQKVGEEKDATWVTCLKDETETMKVSVDDQKKIWKKHTEKLMDSENECSDSTDASKVDSTARAIEVKEVPHAMNQMKIKKASGPSGVALELFKASGDKCFKSLTNIFNILFKDRLLNGC